MTDPKAHPLIFSAPMILAGLADRKTQTRRVVTPRNSLIDGSGKGVRAHWEHLDWSKAWVDRGPSPVGNPGPYWKVPCGCTGVPGDVVHRVYPRYQVGDWVWGEETWRLASINHRIDGAQFWTVQFRDFGVLPHPQPPRELFEKLAGNDRFDVSSTGNAFGRWRSPIHMPRAFSRFERPIVRVGAGFVQDISEEDALAEGVTLRDWKPGEGQSTASWALTHGYAADWSKVGTPGTHGRPLHESEVCLGTAKWAFANLWESIYGNKPGRDWASNPPVFVVDWGTG